MAHGRAVPKKNSLPHGFWRNPVHLVACGLGSGAAPYAPGTFGTAAAIPLFLVLQPLLLWQYVGITLALFIFGVWVCDVTARDFGVHDHSGIVWDEVVGYLITMTAVPAQWQWLLLGFLVFRFFDVLKPWPIRWLDRRVGGGFGIMIDDVLAGLFSLACMQLALRVL